jgi:hypothetical protein
VACRRFVGGDIDEKMVKVARHQIEIEGVVTTVRRRRAGRGQEEPAVKF